MAAKTFKGLSGLFRALRLNMTMLVRKWSSHKIVVFQLHAANQLPHIEAVLLELSRLRDGLPISCFVLVHPSEFVETRSRLNNLKIEVTVSSYYASPFLVFWDIVVTLDQRMLLPLLNWGRGRRVCMFHGQPTKGNVYSGFNYRQIDGLFFYGPLMRDYYHAEKRKHPEWPDVALWELGQPKTDTLFTEVIARVDARISLSLDPTINTVLYAPSFESCASLATDGEKIIDALVSTGCNVIVKPHPSFYRAVNENDDYFSGVPCASEWCDRAKVYTASGRVVFPVKRQVDLNLALQATDVLITDHSGISFEAVMLDKPLVFIDCPEFFSSYLPDKFGVDADKARDDITCNAGRPAGTVVASAAELVTAVGQYLSQSQRHAAERKQLRDSLLFNQGRATEAYVEAIREIVGSNHD